MDLFSTFSDNRNNLPGIDEAFLHLFAFGYLIGGFGGISMPGQEENCFHFQRIYQHVLKLGLL